MRRWLPLLIALELLGPVPPGPQARSDRSAFAAPASGGIEQHQLTADSAHFVVKSFANGPAANDVAARCEAIRSRLCREYFGRAEPLAWKSKCQVVLHSSLGSYRRATGIGSASTVGSSLITARGGRIVERRIDLLATSVDRALSAVPHEMTHVLMADVFPTNPPPRWAEEGLALLADPADKRARHARDLRRALETNTTLPLATFFTSADYPAARDRAVFYAQSMSLAEYLVELDSPQRFVQFVELAQDVGQISALKRVYDIQGLEELENKWQRHAATHLAAPGIVPVSQKIADEQPRSSRIAQ